MSSSERQRSRQRTRALFINTIKATLKKPEKLTVSQWAEKYRVLETSPVISLESGRMILLRILWGLWMHLMIHIYKKLISVNLLR